MRIYYLLLFLSMPTVAQVKKPTNKNKSLKTVTNNLNNARDIINGDQNINTTINIKENYGPIVIDKKPKTELYLYGFSQKLIGDLWTVEFSLEDRHKTHFEKFMIQLDFEDTVENVDIGINGACYDNGGMQTAKSYRYTVESCMGINGIIATITSKKRIKLSISSNYTIVE